MKIKMYNTIILPLFYGCEAWFVILREEHSFVRVCMRTGC
jgi:hypothetical protein